MKLNKKGFTLMELLAVIVILAIIFAVAIPSISSSVERSKTKQLNAKIEVIKAAGEVYISDNNVNDVSLVTLYCNNILTKDELKDPFNDKNSLCGYVYLEDNEYKWNDTSSIKENCVFINNSFVEECN